jgi:hypothetical protein
VKAFGLNVFYGAIFMTEELLLTTDDAQAIVSRHPALALYETVFAVALPAVSVIAGQKNVPPPGR